MPFYVPEKRRSGDMSRMDGWTDGWLYCASIQVTSLGHSGETNQLQSVSESRPLIPLASS